MKYLVNRQTKEHKVATPLAESIIKGYPDFKDDWQLVEADDEGWIPWSGGECPLPGDCAVWVKINGHKYGDDFANVWYWTDYRLTAYRPILSETAEKKEAPAWGGYTEDGQIEPSAFDRLKSALAASESIPGIIAEIDAMLPEGYCVFHCGSQAEKDHTL